MTYKTHWMVLVVFVVCGATAYGQETRQKAAAGQAPGGQRAAGQTPAGQAPASQKDRASYGIGFGIGKNLKQNGIDTQTVTLEMLVRGIRDAISGTQPAVNGAQLDEALTAFEAEMAQKLQQRQQTLGAENKRAGDEYLAQNKARAEVKTLPSGLQYEVVKEGTGPSPSANDVVRVHYHGQLIDGTVFDSSVQRGEPAQFPVNQVIAGWTEALQKMKVGGKWRLFVPPDLAYGPRGAEGSPIGPNAVLVFDVELLGIVEQ